MKLKSFSLAAVAAASLAALALSLAGPASADPAAVPTLSGGGSDTIQDVMNAIATNIGPSTGTQTIGSYDAFQPGSSPIVTHDPITTKSTTACTNISRPNGSGEGVSALRRSLSGSTTVDGATTTATYPTGTGSTEPALGSACFDFARSSSGPGTAASSTGELQYVPFALDGVTMAVGPATGTNATNIKGAFTEVQLQAMYKSETPETATDGVTYDPHPTPAAGDVAIHLTVPQAGSGTRSFFATAMGIDPNALPSWVKDTFVPTGSTTSQSVEEHDGTAVSMDRNAIMPFSTAQWIAQSTGHNDRRHGAVLQNIGGVAPIAGGKLNESFPADFLREVYNVIPFKDTVSTGPNVNVYNVFASPTAPNRLCSRTSQITTFGFGLLTSSPKGHTCGEIASDLRAYANGTF